jgi:catechol 2,3-dioxygenase-like lactoylglutathione lyase family enzyme
MLGAMLETCDVVAFIPTQDLEAARRFYADVLGLRLVESTPIADVFDAHGTQLRVTLVGERVEAPYTALGWKVPDIAAVVQDLVGRGVQLERFEGMDQDRLGIWTAPGGALVAWFRYFDANLLSLTQATPS